jgi:hypothetical protein
MRSCGKCEAHPPTATTQRTARPTTQNYQFFNGRVDAPNGIPVYARSPVPLIATSESLTV